METKRKTAIIYSLILLAIFVFYWLLLTLLRALPQGFYKPGFVYGLLAGTLSCWYLSKTWDPVILKPKNRSQQTKTIRWVMPISIGIGALLVHILESIFNAGTVAILMGTAFSWIFVVFGYMVIQLWRHRIPNQKEPR